MNGELENKPCAKCRSLNPSGISHCKYCHHSLAQLKTFAEQPEPNKKKHKFSRKWLFAGGSAVAVAARYIFRKRKPSLKKVG